jgi:hypothetical protein
MNPLEEIEVALEHGPVTVDLLHWDIVIAGFKTLEEWAKWKGFETEFNPMDNTLRIFRYCRVCGKPGLTLCRDCERHIVTKT